MNDILIIDDEPDVLQTLQSILTSEGYEVCAVIHAEDAIKRFSSGAFDLVITDMKMPEMDGLTVMRQLRDMDENIEIIILTAYADIDNAISAFMDNHAYAYLKKPLENIDDLVLAVKQGIEKRRLKLQNRMFVKQLKDAKKNLELRVEERTSELSRANQLLQKELYQREIVEKELRESEKRYRILAENIADGVCITQDHHIVYTNDAFISLFEPWSSDLLGKNIHDLFQEAKCDGISSALEDSPGLNIPSENVTETENTKSVTHFQLPCTSSTGRQVWIKGRHNTIEWEGKQAILTTVRDITHNKIKELAIKEEQERIKKENITLKSTMKERFKFGSIIGKSEAMQDVYEYILKASASDANIIIFGESGTGKELVARSIHDASERRANNFTAVNCGAIPESLFESEFFGYRKGAFTGANVNTHGFFDESNGGSLFLDEIGELSLGMQVKLLRAIEGGEYTPVGSNKSQKADVRIIAATNRDIINQVKNREMREDFYYRINVISIMLPPLRDRKEDIPLLVDHFIKIKQNGNKPVRIPANIMEMLFNYNWPGNIRELQNVLHRYIAIKRLDFINPNQPQHEMDALQNEILENSQDFQLAMRNFEKKLILKALEKSNWHKANAASLLGLPRRTFFRKIQNLGVK